MSTADALGAELKHIYEEISHKDQLLSEHHDTYLQHDEQLQEHIRRHGSHSGNAKEDSYVDTIRKSQRRVLELQEEKIKLAERALHLVDKHGSRLDAGIANLVRMGRMPADTLTPEIPPSSVPSGSKHVSNGGGGGGAAGTGLASSSPDQTRGTSQDRGGTSVTPGAKAGSNKHHKLGRQGAPSVSPPAGRQVAASLRTGSTGAGAPSGHSGSRRSGRKKPPAKRVSDMGDDEDEGEGKKLYCVCQQPSYGNMVGCDDKECPFKWFHWECVRLASRPRGRWYCPSCATKRD